MTQRLLRNALPLLSLAAGLAVQARGANIVSDGGFESATLGNYNPGPIGDGWIVTAGGIQVYDTADGFGGVPHSGSQYVYLDEGYGVNTISQTLTTVVGQSYTVSFWVADDTANSVIVTFGGQTLFNGTAPTNGVSSAGDYVNFTYSVTATSTSTALTITGQYFNGNGTILDDVSVTPNGVPSTPAPRSLYLCLIGLAGLALYAALTARRHQVV
jgi:hypothetical protein